MLPLRENDLLNLLGFKELEVLAVALTQFVDNSDELDEEEIDEFIGLGRYQLAKNILEEVNLIVINRLDKKD